MDPYQNPATGQPAANPYAPQLQRFGRRRAAFSGLPAPVGVPGQIGGMDYTAQNNEISRQFLASQSDPSSPNYVSPDQQAKFANARQMQGAANPGWKWNQAGNYWSPDAAHNNAAGTAAFASSWENLGKSNPQAFDVPTDAQGRPIDARTGQAAVNQQTGQLYPGSQPAATAPYNPADYQLKAPAMGGQPAGYGQGASPTATMQSATTGPAAPPQSMADAQRASQATVGSPAPAANQAPPVAQQYANPGGTPAPTGMGMDDQRRRLQAPMV